MAKKSYGWENSGKGASAKSHSVADDYSAEFKGYINLNLTQDQKAIYPSWAESASFWQELESETADGVNISLKLEPKSGGYLASGTQRRVSSPNAGLVVTARGSTAALALGRLLYCLAVLSHAERWEDLQPMADPDRW